MKPCDECEINPPMRRYRVWYSETEYNVRDLCDECAERIPHTSGLRLEMIGPTDSPESRVDWAKTQVIEAFVGLVNDYSLHYILRSIPPMVLDPRVYQIACDGEVPVEEAA